MDWISTERWEQFGREGTTAHRLGTERDGWLDRYGDWVVWSGLRLDAWDFRKSLRERFGFEPRGWLARGLSKDAAGQQATKVVAGETPGKLGVKEWGVAYYVEPAGGYSSGLFLDQRRNRHWVRTLQPARTLNLFAYTGSFSVCAALGGGKTLSVDAAKSHLARARENFALNDLHTSSGHRFIAEDAMKIIPRLVRRGEFFDLIVLDPPTFGRGGRNTFRLTRDLPEALRGCFNLLERGGWLLVSCNFAAWTARDLRQVCVEILRGERLVIEPGENVPEIPRGAIAWRVRKG